MSNNGIRKTSAGAVIVYILGLISYGALGYLVYSNIELVHSWIPDFCFDFNDGSNTGSNAEPSTVVFCVIASLMAVFATVVYLSNMSNKGYRPMQLSFIIAEFVSMFLIFGVYYIALMLNLLDRNNAEKVIMGFQIAGTVILAVELIFLIVYKTWRAIPLFFLYIITGYIATVLVLGIVRAILLLVIIIVMFIVFGGGGGKKRIVDKDGTVYEEI